MSDLGTQAPVEALYTERNQAVAVLVALAQRLGYPTWFACADDPDWPIVFIELPNVGQVSWHIPAAEFSDYFPINAALPNKEGLWDSHTNEQKAERLKDEAHYRPASTLTADDWEF